VSRAMAVACESRRGDAYIRRYRGLAELACVVPSTRPGSRGNVVPCEHSGGYVTFPVAGRLSRKQRAHLCMATMTAQSPGTVQ